MSFNPGDQVVVNSGVIATILSYDTGIDLVTYEIPLPGGSTDRHTDHISKVQLTPYAPAAAFNTEFTATAVDAGVEGVDDAAGS